MSPVTDMRTELRKIAERPEFRRIADSKPVHAAAGAGVVATEALREFPARLAKWRTENSVSALEKRASGYVTEVRTRAVHNYDKLALRGKKALAGRPAPKGRSALNGKTGATKPAAK